MGTGRGRPQRRAVVIIGGGIMGVSTAYHLARAGVAGVTVLESAELGSGSSAKPLGGVRAVFSDPANIALGARSLQAFRSFDRELGVDIGLQEVGYLFAIRDPDDIAGFERSVAVQNAMGVPSRLVEPAKPSGTAPTWLRPSWSQPSGHRATVSPGPLTSSAATPRGPAGWGRSCGPTPRSPQIEPTADGQALVHTAAGSFVTPTVVCAAGAWSGRVGSMVGVDLPIRPLRRQIAFTPPLTPRPPRVPFTIDYSTTAYFHGSEDGGLLLGWADPQEGPGFGRDVSCRLARSVARGLAQVRPGGGRAAHRRRLGRSLRDDARLQRHHRRE